MEFRFVKGIALVALWMGATVGLRAQTVVEYIHTDALGTPVAVTNAAGTVIERSVYEPYGQLINRPLTDGPGFTGHVQDAATGLTYMQQRYYDPMIGRVLSVDPVTANPKNGGNFNRYWYASGNPYKFIDPDGRYGCEASKTQCLQVDRAMSKVYVAQENATGNAKKVLDGIVGLLGKKGDGNGVVIKDTNKGSGSWRDLAKGGVLRVNFGTLNSSAAGLGKSAQDFMVASTLVHEGWHGWWGKLAYAAGISDPWSRSYSTNNERRAGISEGVFAQSLNYSHPQGFWTTQGGFDMGKINEQAAASVASMCAESARGGVSCGD
jgi:RHS repeat-associated protein